MRMKISTCLRLFTGRNSWTQCASFSTAKESTPKGTSLQAEQGKLLKRFVVDKIRATGPITVYEYMKLAVSAPEVGYYGRYSEKQPVFGEKGDFITAPELTQMFGELIGVWIYYELSHTGYNGEWALIENGPGTGQLMSDVLNVMHKFKETKMSVHIVETSTALIEKQERFLCAFNSTPPGNNEDVPYLRKNTTKTGVPIYWYHNVDDIPEKFSVFICNEFLDALPIHQFKRDEKGRWNEIYVALNDKNDLVFMNSKGENLHTRGLLPDSIREDKTMDHYELAPDAGTYVNQVAERIVTNGGFAVIVDYGHDGTRKDFSFRAYRKHELVNPLSRPGEIDLTADVNFGFLKDLIRDRTLVYGPCEQREFFGQLGIRHRLHQLLKMCEKRADQENLIKAYNYLMGDMGEKFKVMSVFPKTLGTIMEKRGGPAGFNTMKQPSSNQGTE